MLTAENVLHKYNPLVPFKNASMHAMYSLKTSFFSLFFSIICVQYGIVRVKIESETHGSASIGEVIAHLFTPSIYLQNLICMFS